MRSCVTREVSMPAKTGEDLSPREFFVHDRMFQERREW